MANIIELPKTENDIFIVDQRLHDSGLTIQFIIDGKDGEIDLNEFEAAELLSKYGIVASSNHEGKVYCDMLDRHNEGGMEWIDWELYVRCHSLSDDTAKEIVIGEEREKELKNESLGAMAFRHAKIITMCKLAQPK